MGMDSGGSTTVGLTTVKARMADQPKLRVAIVGGGMGGLTCALILGKQLDIDVHIYEAAHRFGEVGAGIGMWPRVWKIMKALGLYEDMEAAARRQGESGNDRSFLMRKSDRKEGVMYHRRFANQETSETGFFHRADFQKVLLRHIAFGGNVHSHFSKRLVSYAEAVSSDRKDVTLTFEDGSTVRCDVLIGADGIKSAVRRTMVRDRAASAATPAEAKEWLSVSEPVWTGTVCYRGLVTREELEKGAPGHPACESFVTYTGKDKHVIVYPISRGQNINVAAFCTELHLAGTPFGGPTVAEVGQQELLEQFAGWEEEVQVLFQRIEHPNRWAIHALRPLMSYVSQGGRVALLGDAAHAMTPHQGSGAGQAIEDAYILAMLLSHSGCTLAMLPIALHAYDHVRRPYADGVVQISHETGLLYEENSVAVTRRVGEGVDGKEEMAWLKRVGREVDKVFMWAMETTIEEDREKAVRAFEEKLGV